MSTSRERPPRKQLIAGIVRRIAPIPVRRRLRALALSAAVALCILPALAGHAEGQFPGIDVDFDNVEDDELLEVIVQLAVLHDLGIPIGLLPLPFFQSAGEFSQYIGNWQLKYLPPLLREPNDFNMEFYPHDDGDGDACSYHFTLPNSKAVYENMFGLIPIFPSYYEEKTGRTYSWANRWGVLTPPLIYHANSTARLSVSSAGPVQRYDEVTGTFTEPYFPILDQYSPSVDIPRVWNRPQPDRMDRDGQPASAGSGSQEVYLPIGDNTLHWSAATQLNEVTDKIVPGLLLAIGLLTELKNARSGKKAAKKAKALKDNPKQMAKEMASSKDAEEALAAKNKFTRLWKSFLKEKENNKKSKSLAEKFQERLIKATKNKLLCPLFDKVLRQKVAEIEANTGALLESQGHLTPLERKVIDVLYEILLEEGVEPVIDDIEEECKPSGKQKYVKKVVVALLERYGLEPFVTYDTAVRYLSQNIRIWDNVPPVWDTSQGPLECEASDIEGVQCRQCSDILECEATDIGGMRPARVIVALRAAAAERVSDNCGRVPEVRGTMDGFFKLYEDNPVIWTAYDGGPNPPPPQGTDQEAWDEKWAPKSTQIIRVVDTQPPLLLAPPSKVIEVPMGAMQKTWEDDPSTPEIDEHEEAKYNEIGYALATDVADAQPTIEDDAPDSFTVDQRRVVEWTARDESGNETTTRPLGPPPPDCENPAECPVHQLITVKEEGTNDAPVAFDTSAVTSTAEPVEITLNAEDTDKLDVFDKNGVKIRSNVPDPLWFKIEEYPKEGQFIAPLLPFFIKDYRTKPGDALKDHYAKDGDGYPDPDKVIVQDFIDSRGGGEDGISEYIARYYCDEDYASDENYSDGPPRNFVHEAFFVEVTDAGIRYVLDKFFTCLYATKGHVVTDWRISKWTAAGEFLGQKTLGRGQTSGIVSDAFVLDRDGFLYYSEVAGSENFVLNRCEADFVDEDCQTVLQRNGEIWEYARTDSSRNLVYLADRTSIFAFDLRENRRLDELGPKVFPNDCDPVNNDCDAVIPGWFGRTDHNESVTLEVGSDGSLYIADVQHHRIHKIAPPTIDAAGKFVPGAYIGWSGRCTGGAGCDKFNGRSYGYTCTFDPNSGCEPTLGQRTTIEERALFFGDGQGQFNTPKYIAIDPYDVLYIADYENSRVQRLSPGGSFAGEAVSTGTGVNKGDQPSFILGNMGMPASVSVNSSQFYVVDKREHFVHVFGALPFKEITDNSAVVTYKSENNFPNPDDVGVDDFTFTVSDGLAVSLPATVSVTVNRAFRPPVAFADRFTIPEDSSPFDFELHADDPDGIKGQHFLGREGLDTLTYTVTAPPQHGTLEDSDACGEDTPDGACKVYTPNSDYYGEDRLRFEVDDGFEYEMEDKKLREATVVITVTPINDPPVLTIAVPERVALGFPTLVTSTLTDDLSEGYEATAEWGDGQSSKTGRLAFDDEGVPHIVEEDDLASDDGGVPYIVDDHWNPGIAVSAPPGPETEGATFAEHVYQTLGPRTMEVCVTDSGEEEGCDSAEINVEELVSLFIAGRVYTGPRADEEPLAGDDIEQQIDEIVQQIDDDQDFTYELTIVNQLRVDGTGLTAVEVDLEVELPKLIFGTIEASRGTCVPIDTGLTCALDNLESGAEVTVTIPAFGPGNLLCNEDFAIEATLTTLSDALEDEMEFPLSVELLADDPDSNCDIGMEVPDGGIPNRGGPDGGIEPPGLDPNGTGPSGCSCRVAGPSDYDTSVLLLVLAFGGWCWRRRRVR